VQTYQEAFNRPTTEAPTRVLPRDTGETSLIGAQVERTQAITEGVQQLSSAYLQRKQENDRLAATAAYNRFSLADIENRTNIYNTKRGKDALDLDMLADQDPTKASATVTYSGVYDETASRYNAELSNPQQQAMFSAMTEEKKVSSMNTMVNYQQGEREAFEKTQYEGVRSAKTQEAIDDPAYAAETIAIIEGISNQYYTTQGYPNAAKKEAVQADTTYAYSKVVDSQLQAGDIEGARETFDTGVKRKSIAPEEQAGIEGQIDTAFVNSEADRIAVQTLAQHETTADALKAIRDSRDPVYKSHPDLKAKAYSQTEAYALDRDRAAQAQKDTVQDTTMLQIRESSSYTEARNYVDRIAEQNPDYGDVVKTLDAYAAQLYGVDGDVETNIYKWSEITNMIDTGEIATEAEYTKAAVGNLSNSDFKERLNYFRDGGRIGNLPATDMIDSSFDKYTGGVDPSENLDLYAAYKVEVNKFIRDKVNAGEAVTQDQVDAYGAGLLVKTDAPGTIFKKRRLEQIAAGETAIIPAPAAYADRLSGLKSSWAAQFPDLPLESIMSDDMITQAYSGAGEDLEDFTVNDVVNYLGGWDNFSSFLPPGTSGRRPISPDVTTLDAEE